MTGCGGGGITEEDRDRAREVAADYGRAFAAQDGEAGCRLLTGEMRARYERRRGESCAAAFRWIASVDEERRLRFRQAAITGEHAEGVNGIVEFSGNPGMGGAVRLVERDGQWRLDLDLLCITPDCDP